MERFRSEFGVPVAGIDINQGAVNEARRNFPDSIIKLGMAEEIPFPDKSFDLVLTDACLIYVPPDKIANAVSEITRVARKYIILCEWHGPDQFDGHWVRNYFKTFENYNIELTKITDWGETGGWAEWGHIIKVDLENKREHLSV